ncbi:DUF1800 family protein [Cerasicoccus fimbriatus]|uniref:DUF1800 family protein n=1 Tax=Cerasicoccus fimbriatus TaxID=3014554 RepID=UPI0022B3027F|nr:DUF1800 family protein [Cerasicoccus sp. TK19100]
MKTLFIGIIVAAALFSWKASGQVDQNGNAQSDVWEMRYQAQGLLPGGDADGDGMTNLAEAEAGTDPFDPSSNFKVMDVEASGNMLRLDWMGSSGKLYQLEYAPVLGGPWQPLATFNGQAAAQEAQVDFAAHPGFFRIVVTDLDSDGDGVFDWEELELGFDPDTANTARYSQDDLARIETALAAGNVVTVAALQSEIDEAWAVPGYFLIQRTGGLDAMTVALSFGGSATPGVDYAMSNASIDFALGQIAAWVPVSAIEDGQSEGAETISLTINSGADYTVGTPGVATMTIADSSAGISAREASRFLAQATFGPTPDTIADVQAVGFDAWIADQFAQPIGEHEPILLSYDWDLFGGAIGGPYSHHKMLAWWQQAMNAPDPLRQRVAFALSEILVISDTNGGLDGNAIGMLNYYDMLLEHSFGNYRDLLEAVTYHPCMGVFLSHRGNLPADPSINRFPDENYAREIMQLFSIGLWMLNEDGTRQLDQFGQPIPTYSNSDITNLASVFTGMSWGQGDTSLWWEFYWPTVANDEYWRTYTEPMTIWEGPYSVWSEELGMHVQQYFHEQGPKTILGVELPGNDPESPEANYAANDIDRALDVIFNHPNVGPFIGRLLIQRLVTSNPSNGYVARVAEAFNGGGPHNPTGVRGDMQSVIRAILLDDEAREADMISDLEHGMLRENYLRYVGLARAFDAASPSGNYPIFWVNRAFGQQPLSSPSVFNFFSPDYQPLGAIRNAGLVAPEFQILTAVTGISIPNQLRQAIENRLNWPQDASDYVTLDLSPAVALVNDVDALIEYLDTLLTFGNMSPQLHETLRMMLARPEYANASDEFKVQSAIYLIVSSADAAVLR